MRKLIAAAAVLAVTSAHAEELKFGDLNYFLKQGQFNVTADASSTYYKQSFEGGSTYETRGYLFETKYGFGISDKFNVYLGVDYAFDREVEDKTTGTNADFTQDGFANPALIANYRVMNQNEARYNFDLGAVAKVNVQEAAQGSSVGQDSTDGNYADGRSSLELNARMGRKWNEANEWQIGAGTVYHLDGESEGKGPVAEDKDLDSSFDIFVRAAYQYRPVNEFMMSITGEATRIGDADSELKDSNADVTDEAHIDMKAQFRAKYLITDTFIANFHYSWSRLAEYDMEVDGTDTEIKRRRENFFGVGVDFLF